MTTRSEQQAFGEMCSQIKAILDDVKKSRLIKRDMLIHEDVQCGFYVTEERSNGRTISRIEFRYDLPVVAPPAGSIVEAGNDDAWGTALAYSSGKLTDLGKLWTCPNKEAALGGRLGACYSNWRVIEKAGD
jgi:hypothetical protein